MTLMDYSIIKSQTHGIRSTDISLNRRPLIHIYIPAYNEEKTICSVISNIRGVLSGEYSYKITVVDDGSKDNTSKLVRNYGNDVSLLRNRQNAGKGSSIRRAICDAHPEDIIVFMDADGEHRAVDLPRLLEPILRNQVDMVIGSRFLSSTLFDNGSYLKNGKKFNQIRKFGNKIFSIFTSLLFHTYISDTQSGFRAFRGSIGQQFHLKAEGFQIEIEMTIEALRHRCRVVEVPIDNGYCGRPSYMNFIIDSMKIGLILLLKRFAPNLDLFHFLYQTKH